MEKKANVGLMFLLLWSTSIDAARILVVFPFPGHSHHLFCTAIMKALVLRGHHIVEYSPHPPDKHIPNHTHVEIHTSFENQIAEWNYESFLYQTTHLDKSFYGCKFRRIWEMNDIICEETLSHPNMKKLLTSDEEFDLVMIDSTFGQESLLAIGHRFSAPTVVIETLFPFSILKKYAGNSLEISSVPDLTSPVFENEPMSFTNRIINFISVSLTLLEHWYIHLPLHEEIISRHFDIPLPPLAEMVANVSLYLVNSYSTAIPYVQSYSPNIIPVGGITISTDKNSLSQDVLKFMEDAKEGVIYFSLGSVVPIHVIPKEILSIFVNVFKRMPQKIIWKIPRLHPTIEVPKNVLIKEWAPQAGILAHPNCKAFITHGGLMSTHEAVYSAVPLVGIPFFSDQPYNVRLMVQLGVGIKLDFVTLSEESLRKALTEVLSNPRYKDNALKLSRIYRDRPYSAEQAVGFWVDYVLKHRGAHHLRPAAAALPWYQLLLLDVLASIFIATLSVTFILFTIQKRIFKMFKLYNVL